jgi:hypothetical protein
MALALGPGFIVGGTRPRGSVSMSARGGDPLDTRPNRARVRSTLSAPKEAGREGVSMLRLTEAATRITRTESAGALLAR